MKNILLHVGQPKTGSSSIQYFLRKHGAPLARAGFFYPGTKNTRINHNAVLPPLLRGETAPSRLRQRFSGDSEAIRLQSQAEWNEIVEKACKSPAETVILSAERMFGIGTEERACEQRAQLHRIGSDIQVVAYIRSPVPHYLSALQQSLKRDPELLVPVAAGNRHDLEIYERVFGGIVLRAFDRKQLEGGDAVMDFVHHFVSPELARTHVGRTMSRNETMSAEAMALLQDLLVFCGISRGDRLSPEIGRARRFLRQEDLRLDGFSRPRLRPEIAEHVNRTAGDFLWLRDRFGLVFDDLDYDLIGTASTLDTAAITRVEQVCELDAARLDTLRARYLARLTEAGPRRLRAQIGDIIASGRKRWAARKGQRLRH